MLDVKMYKNNSGEFQKAKIEIDVNQHIIPDIKYQINPVKNMG